jgi:integrase
MLGHYDVRDIDFERLESFKDALSRAMSPKTQKKLKSKTRKNNLYALHEFFVWLSAKQVVSRMPVFPAVRNGNDATPRRALTYEQQLEGLLKIPAVHRDIFEFGFELGLRPGETCAVRIKDVDLRKKVVIIQRTWSGSRLKEGTKENTKIPVPLSDTAYEIARRIITERISGIPDINIFEEFLFVHPSTGRHYTRWTLWDLWKKYVGNVTHYEASRHSFCTQIVDCCEDVFAAKDLMRQADIRSTLAYYHPTQRKHFEIINMRGRNRNNVIDIDGKKRESGE